VRLTHFDGQKSSSRICRKKKESLRENDRDGGETRRRISALSQAAGARRGVSKGKKQGDRGRNRKGKEKRSLKGKC